MKQGTLGTRKIGIAGLVLALLSVLLVAPAVQALSLGPSDVYYSKTYYSTPNYKASTGASIMTVSSIAQTYGGFLKTGMRTNNGGSGESTQFPRSDAGVSVQYRNVDAPPGYAYTFSSGTYYFTAQLAGVFSNQATTWNGNVSW